MNQPPPSRLIRLLLALITASAVFVACEARQTRPSENELLPSLQVSSPTPGFYKHEMGSAAIWEMVEAYRVCPLDIPNVRHSLLLPYHIPPTKNEGKNLVYDPNVVVTPVPGRSGTKRPMEILELRGKQMYELYGTSFVKAISHTIETVSMRNYECLIGWF